MSRLALLQRASGACQRRAARWFGRRPFALPRGRPIVSFTFDDFPRTALDHGGAILERLQFAGTYYTALGIAGSGDMFVLDDLHRARERGHELGCHTFAHCPAWETSPEAFEESVCRNADMLQHHFPGEKFRSLSYPISYPRPATKHRVGRHFACCRGGGQTFNTGTVDLNYLSAYFLEQCGSEIDAVQRVIDANAEAGGWLIFATHDISDVPSRFGCTTEFFRQVVHLTAISGAEVLPVARAWDVLRSRTQSASLS